MTTRNNFPPHAEHEEILETLHELLAKEHVVALGGEAGSGKTTLARNFVNRFQAEYQHIIWIDAATPELLLCSVQALAADERLFTRPLPADIEGITACIQDWALHLPQSLLVLDHVQLADPESPEYAQFGGTATQRPAAHMLLLPAANTRPADIAYLPLQPFDTRTGTRFVMSQAQLLDAETSPDELSLTTLASAGELVRELQGLPLPLLLASRLLALTSLDFSAYLAAYRDLPEPAMRATDEASAITALTLELTLQHLARSSPLARAMLTCCALLAPQPIPLTFFEQPALLPVLFPDFPALDQQASRLENIHEALQTLLAAGLLTETADSDELSMPRQIHTLLRTTLSTEQVLPISEALLLACLQLAQAQTRETPTLNLLLAGHIRALAVWYDGPTEASEKVAEAFAWAASLLHEVNLPRETVQLLHAALVIWERTLGPVHPTIAGTLTHLALLHARLQNYRAAEIHATSAITTTSQALGVNHPKVLYGLLVLSQIYLQQDKHQQARLCLEKALSTGDVVGLQQHPYYKDAQRQLEALYQKDFDKVDGAADVEPE